MSQPIVIDSGVAIKWFVVEPHSAQANLIYDDYENGKFEFLAPDLIYSEIGNILWKKQIFENLDESDVKFAIKQFQQIVFQITPASALFEDALQIAIAQKRTFYDSLYLALAQRENCQFVTADEKLDNAVNSTFSKNVLLANWK